MWAAGVGDQIRAMGEQRKGWAQVASIGVNAVGTSAILAVFVHTGGLTGAEVGIAAATAVVNQKLLEAIFGEANVAAFVDRARGPPSGTLLDAAFDAERRRFGDALGGLADAERPRPSSCGIAPRRRAADAGPVVTLDTQLDRTGARRGGGARGRPGGRRGRGGCGRRPRARAARLPGPTYVLALAGGTGVGKSSLLNALAGQTVSAVRAVRPTTDQPLAWVAESRRDELAPLLAWLGVRHVVAHADKTLAGVAILDLPDVDSVRTEHRATVDALLPRIDAVAWVLDPEKYDDARLHTYLRGMTPHAARLRFVLNKSDRLTDLQRGELAGDLRRRLTESGIDDARVDVVSATTGDGIDLLRAGLADEADAKALVTAKLETDASEAHDRLARAVGLESDAAYRPLLDDARQTEATRAAVAGALELVDPPGVARQVQLAVLARARRTGGSLLGRIVALLLAWLTGQSRRNADPAAYLRDWRRRGSLGRAVNPVNAALLDATAAVPSSSRAPLVATLRAAELEEQMGRALDAVAREAAGDLRIRGSILWPLVGAVQLAIGAVFAFAVAWYVTLFVSGGQVPVSAVEVPLLGPLPLPLVLLVASVVASAVIGMLLSLHAGWIGRRIGGRVAERVRTAVASSVAEAGFGGLERVEQARRRMGGMT